MESLEKINTNKDICEIPSENIHSDYLINRVDSLNQFDKDPLSSRTQISIESTIVVPNDLSLYNSNNSEYIDTFSVKSSKHHKNSKSSANNSFMHINKVNNSVSFDLDDFEKFNFNKNNDTKDLKKDPMERRLTIHSINSVNSENLQESIRKLNLSSKNKKVNLFTNNNSNVNSYPLTNNYFQLGGRKFSAVKKLGKGSYGSVYLIKDEDNNSFALKKYYEKQFEKVSSHVHLIKSLNHECLPKIYNSFRIEKTDYVIQDYYPITLNEVILKYLHNQKSTNLNQSKIADERERSAFFASIAFQLINGLNSLHTKMIIHRDIKPTNIMITYDGIVKLIDFDLIIKIENQYETLSSEVASIFYLPPEIFLGDECYGFGLDIWSLGCVLAEMYLGYPIFKADNSLSVLAKIKQILGENDYLNNNLNLIKSYLKENSEEMPFEKLFANCYGPFVTILRSLFQLDPKQRSSLSTILSSDYFKNMNLEMSKLIIKECLSNLLLP
jgi:RIO-like serine/threonine protein kinase